MVINGSLTIASGGKINVDGMGYKRIDGWIGAGPGKGILNIGKGGGHGGEGNSGGGGTTYGSITNPVNSGSSGSGTGTGGGPGGGTVVLRVTGSVTHNGVITANGGVNQANCDGAGGTINLTAASISGGGSITAQGGSSGGGGGGRIAVRITGGTVPSSIYNNISAIGSTTAGFLGGAGTIYIVDAQQTNLIVDNKNNNGTIYATTLLRDGSYQFPGIVLTNNGVLAVGTNATLDLTGCTLVTAGSTTNQLTSRLVARDYGQLTWSGTFTDSAVISCYSNGTITGGSLIITNGGILTHEGPGTLSKKRTLLSFGFNRIYLTLSGDLTVANNGTIWAKGMGYTGNWVGGGLVLEAMADKVPPTGLGA